MRAKDSGSKSRTGVAGRSQTKTDSPLAVHSGLQVSTRCQPRESGSRNPNRHRKKCKPTLDRQDDTVQLGPRLPAHQRIRVLHDMRKPFLKHRDGPLVGIKLGRVGDFLGAGRAGLDNVEVGGVAVGRPEPEGVAVR